MLKRVVVFAAIVGVIFAAKFVVNRSSRDESPPPLRKAPAMNASDDNDPALLPLAKDDAEWQKRLTPEQFKVARRKGRYALDFWGIRGLTLSFLHDYFL